MSIRTRRVPSAIVAGALLSGVLVGLTGPAHAAPTSSAAPSVAPSTAQVGELEVTNSFVSAVGWVKPGESYPSRIVLTNHGALATTAAVKVAAPTGSVITGASTGGLGTLSPLPTTTLFWNGVVVPAGATKVLVLESEARTTDELATIVWRDLSSTVTVTTGLGDAVATSHGPKVIPPGGAWDTARYGDRPFPVVPVQYQERPYADTHAGGDLEAVINDPAKPGSTYNLYQEMSLGQLFPDADVPSAGVATASFEGTDSTGHPYSGDDFAFTHVTDTATGFQPGPGSAVPTCTGATFGDSPTAPGTNPLYTERITNGVYNLPGTTGYYGQDGSGSAVIGSVAGTGALMQIDNGCGPTSKIVYDAALIADPEIDYSDFDTDKDGIVDFFMAVFAGCGGNGASQTSTPATPCSDNPTDQAAYDNVWPHSSSLEYYYSDPTTGLPGLTTHDQLKDLEGRPLWYTDTTRKQMTATDKGDALKVFVRIGPYNLNPETAIDKASVISHEYGHSLGLPDFYSIDPGGRETYGDWNLMATDKSQNMDAFSRQKLGWVVPEVLTHSQSVHLTDSKHDTGTITWQTPDGAPYTLEDGVDGTVHNSQMYVAKLPGVSLLDPAKFATGDTATKTHAWFSGAGNDFGCPLDGQGHNLDVNLPAVKDLPAGSTVKLEFKSLFEMEWDYDYGFVLTSKDAGDTWSSHASTRDTPTTTESANPNASACMASLGNGITGDSSSYTDPVAVQLDRATAAYPDTSFIGDSFDISDLVGAASPVLRFSYYTDPGVAKAGWFIDDLKVTATTPSGDTILLDTDLEGEGGPDDPRFFSGGCKEDIAIVTPCSAGWRYVNAGAEAPFDHAYYLELRDRSGFDIDGFGQIDRDPIGWTPGVYAAYTDEARGYGNVGVTGLPAQSPLDANPTPGDITPDLNNAAFVPGTGTAPNGPNAFSDATATPHVDNYVDDAGANWTLKNDCLSFLVTAIDKGANPTPTDASPVSTTTGDMSVTMGPKCGTFDYGYEPSLPPPNTAPVAVASANPTTAAKNQTVTFSGVGSHDAETPTSGLDYAWDFDGDGSKDATGISATHAFATTGSHLVTLTVSDGEGATDTDRVTVNVTAGGNTAPTAKLSVSKSSPLVTQQVTLSAAGSSDAQTPASGLVYRWNFGDGGSAVDATGPKVTTKFTKAGPRIVTLTVVDPQGLKSSVSKRIVVRREIVCIADAVTRTGSWRRVNTASAPGGNYCDNLGGRAGADTLELSFRGPQVDLFYGKAAHGGAAVLYIDGHKVGTVDFHGFTQSPRLKYHQVFKNLGSGRHTVKLVVTRGQAYVDGFIIAS